MSYALFTKFVAPNYHARALNNFVMTSRDKMEINF